jgi:hypothetical protein
MHAQSTYRKLYVPYPTSDTFALSMKSDNSCIEFASKATFFDSFANQFTGSRQHYLHQTPVQNMRRKLVYLILHFRKP